MLEVYPCGFLCPLVLDCRCRSHPKIRLQLLAIKDWSVVKIKTRTTEIPRKHMYVRRKHSYEQGDQQ